MHTTDPPTDPRRRVPAPRPVVPPTLALRPEAWSPEALADFGWRSLTECAEHLGVHSSTLRRAMAGQTDPGATLVAAAVRGRRQPFHELFTIVEPEEADTP